MDKLNRKQVIFHEIFFFTQQKKCFLNPSLIGAPKQVCPVIFKIDFSSASHSAFKNIFCATVMKNKDGIECFFFHPDHNASGCEGINGYRSCGR